MIVSADGSADEALVHPVQVMGVVNVTPDSFSDGGQFYRHDVAMAHALTLVEQGADILDIGGESTRPGAGPVAEGQELDRVIPVIKELSKRSGLQISIDTSKPQIMRAAVDAGACMINDVMALRAPGALAAAAELEVSVCLMHMQGEPRTMQALPTYMDVVAEVRDFLEGRIDACLSAGIPKDRLLIDPGFGFGKTLDHNLTLLAGLGQLRELGVPVLVGLSRKSMFQELLGLPVEHRGPVSVSAAAIAAVVGADFVRTHDVLETVQAVRLAEQVRWRFPAQQRIFAN